MNVQQYRNEYVEQVFPKRFSMERFYRRRVNLVEIFCYNEQMQSVYLVRHGEYSNPRNILAGRLPVELSEIGITQAEKLREFFKDKNINVIYSSAVHRCKQTSEIIADKKISIKYDTRLLETHSAYQGYWVKDWSHFFDHQQELGGESIEDIQKRIVAFFEEVTKKEEGNFIICSHGDPLYALLCFLFQKSVPGMRSELPDYPQTGTAREIIVDDHGSITIA